MRHFQQQPKGIIRSNMQTAEKFSRLFCGWRPLIGLQNTSNNIACAEIQNTLNQDSGEWSVKCSVLYDVWNVERRVCGWSSWFDTFSFTIQLATWRQTQPGHPSVYTHIEYWSRNVEFSVTVKPVSILHAVVDQWSWPIGHTTVLSHMLA